MLRRLFRRGKKEEDDQDGLAGDDDDETGFENFKASANGLLGFEMNDRWLADLWDAADSDMERAINWLMDTPAQVIEANKKTIMRDVAASEASVASRHQLQISQQQPGKNQPSSVNNQLTGVNNNRLQPGEADIMLQILMQNSLQQQMMQQSLMLMQMNAMCRQMKEDEERRKYEAHMYRRAQIRARDRELARRAHLTTEEDNDEIDSLLRYNSPHPFRTQ